MSKDFILRWVGNTLFVILSVAILVFVILGAMFGFAGLEWLPYCLMLMHTLYIVGFTLFYVVCGLGMSFIPPHLLVHKFKILWMLLALGVVLTCLSQWLNPMDILRS